MNRKRLFLLCICVAMLFCGACTQSIISESPSSVALPPVDPMSGTVTAQTVTLYFRLAFETALAPAARTIEAGPRDSLAELAIESLLKGPAEGELDFSSALPPGVRLLHTTRENDVLSVTLSREFLSRAHLSGNQETIRLMQRMSVYAIVNTVCALPGQNINMVEILVDQTGEGGSPVAPAALGFSGDAYAALGDTRLLPLYKSSEYAVNQKTMASLALARLAAQEYSKAYVLFVKGAGTEYALPELAAFERQFSETFLLTEFEIKGFDFYNNPLGIDAILDLTLRGEDGGLREITDAAVLMRLEDGIYKLDYHALTAAITQTSEAA